MAILKNLLGIREIKSPRFYKEFKEENTQLLDLLDLKEKVKSSKSEDIEKDIQLLKANIQGEKKVYSSLVNSSIPMICLHDVRIQSGEYIAQLDFVVITAKFIMILEVKKLNGEIHINESGDFIRYIKNEEGKIIKEEEIHSPIEQNDDNIKIIRNMLIEEDLIKTLPVISGVIIASPNSSVNKSKAPKKIKNEIFRYDQLKEVIRDKMNCYSTERKMFEDQMKKIGDFFIANNKEITYDYNKKYSLTEADFIEEKIEEIFIKEPVQDTIEEVASIEVEDNEVIGSLKSYDELIENLKEYRLNKSKEEKIRYYFVYTDEMIDEIIELNPKDKKELIQIRGFGPMKIEKYGQDIIDIISG